MIEFLRKILALVKPYKGRLALGILCGILGGLTNPLLMFAVKISMEVVFPGEGAPLVEIPHTRNGTNAAQGAFSIKAAAPDYIIQPASNSLAMTRWPGTSLTNHLTITLEDGSNTLHREFLVTAQPNAAEKSFSGLSGQTQGWSQSLNSRLHEIGVSRDRKWIALVILMIPLAMLLRGVFTYLNAYFMTWVSVRATNDLRMRLFSHVLHQPISFFNKTSTGELMAIVGRVPILQGLLGESLGVLIREPVTVIGLLALLLMRHRDLMLVSIFIFPVCVGAAVFFGRKTRKTAASSSRNAIQLTQQTHEAFTAMRVVKAYNLENSVIDHFHALSRQVVSNTMRLVRAQEIPGPLIEFFGAFGVAVFFMFIATKTGAKPTAGDFMEFVGSVFLMYAPIKLLVRLNSQVEQARTLSEPMFKILNTQTTVPEPANPVPLQAKGALIEFQNVSFSYGDKPVLKNIHLTVKPGQLVAFVGQSGSGKTTLTHLLLRFYDPQQGVIRIGGTDIRQVRSKELREQIAVVTQETILFNDTIRKNIELGRPGASEAEIIAAAKHAHAHDFIMEKPAGYDTAVGEKGANLSGGQKQRITIARAILRDTPILILDEATNALDAESEHAVQKAFDELMQGRTTFCVAHKLSTIMHADVIVVMQDGVIVETGTHAELLKKQGVYHMLHKLQFESKGA